MDTEAMNQMIWVIVAVMAPKLPLQEMQEWILISFPLSFVAI